MIFKSRLRVTQGHWKRHHWVDHTRLTISRVIWRWILSWLWNVGQRSLKVIENGTIWKLGYGFLFASYSDYDPVSVAVCEIFSVNEWRDLGNHFNGCSKSLKWSRLYVHMYIVRLSIGRLLYLVPFSRTLNSIVTLKSGLEVTQGHWNWCRSKAWVRFLFTFYSNYSTILYRLRDIATYW